MRASDACTGSDILESAISEIAIEGVGTFEIAEVEIAQAVAIEITRSQSGAVEKILVGL